MKSRKVRIGFCSFLSNSWFGAQQQGLPLHGAKRSWSVSNSRDLKLRVHERLTEHLTGIVTHHNHSYKELLRAPFYLRALQNDDG